MTSYYSDVPTALSMPDALAGVRTLVNGWMSRSTLLGQQFTKKAGGKRSLEVPILSLLKARLYPHAGMVRNAQGWGSPTLEPVPVLHHFYHSTWISRVLLKRLKPLKDTKCFVS